MANKLASMIRRVETERRYQVYSADGVDVAVPLERAEEFESLWEAGEVTDPRRLAEALGGFVA